MDAFFLVCGLVELHLAGPQLSGGGVEVPVMPNRNSAGISFWNIVADGGFNVYSCGGARFVQIGKRR